MESLRPWIEAVKYLSACDLLRTAFVSRMMRKVTESNEVWVELLESQSKGLITNDIRALFDSPKRLYQALYAMTPSLHCIIGANYTSFPIPFRNIPVRETLANRTDLTKSSFLIRLPDTSIFACGGDVHSDSFHDYGLRCVYRIHPLSLSIQQLEDLPAPRRYPCGLYYSASVYIFGGSDYDTMLKTAAKYDFATGKWRELPQMLEARCSTTPCRYNNEIYLIAGVPATGAEAFNITTERYRQLPIQLGGVADSVTVVISQELIVFTLRTVNIYALPDCSLVHSGSINSDDYVWSHTQPLVYKGQVWFYYWHRGCLADYNSISRVFSLHSALSYTQMKTAQSH